MSLINEALKRARIEAARQEAAKRGDPPTGAPAHLARHRISSDWHRRLLAALLLVTAGAVAALIGIRVAGREQVGQPNLNSESEATLAAAEINPTQALSTPPAAVEAEAAFQEPRRSLPQRRSRPAQSQGGGDPRSSPQVPEADPASTPTPGKVSEAPGRSPSRSKREEGRSPEDTSSPEAIYRGRMETATGSLELGGIAWSETGPFALINGRVVGPGETIHGFVIERILPRQVELRGPDGPVVLMLR